VGELQHCSPYERGAPEFLHLIWVHWTLSGVTRNRNLLYYLP